MRKSIFLSLTTAEVSELWILALTAQKYFI